MITLYIVIPCYNEEACLRETIKRLKEKFKNLISSKQISKDSRIVFVDDGSKDETWSIISNNSKNNIVGLKLSRNRGHQNALLAGLSYASDFADFIITIDADLQDDINAIEKMIEKYSSGYEVVYGVRRSRKTDSFFKRNSARSFYKFMNWLGVELIYDSADYRGMSSRAVKELLRYEESNLFLRGIVPLVGLKSTTVEYDRSERFAGVSKYPLKKMLNFAWDGVTSFSIKPIRFVLKLGFIMLLVSTAVMLYSVIMKFLGRTVDGWTFVICSIWLIGAIQMVSIGLIGEYVGKIYTETKKRPRFLIEEVRNGKV